MRFIPVTVIWLFHYGLILSQENAGIEGQENLNLLGSGSNGSMVRTFDDRYEGVRGSPFFIEEWAEGEIRGSNGKIYTDLQLKYNAYTDEVLSKNQNLDPLILDRVQITGFELRIPDKGEVFQFVKLPDPKKENATKFFRVLLAGKASLYETTDVIFTKADYKGGYSQGQRYDEFSRRKDYFISFDGNDLQKVKGSARSFIRMFTGQESKMESFLKQHPVNMNDPSDLVKAVHYFNSIQ